MEKQRGDSELRNWRLFNSLLACALVFFSILFVYFKTHTFSLLNFDDNLYVSDNPIVVQGLSWPGLGWAFSTTEGGHWHPLSWLSHMLDVTLFGMDSGAMHLVNVGLHIANCIILLFLLKLLTKNGKVALISVLLFALHPLRIESVAWVSQRKDLLSLFFGLLTCLTYLNYYYSRLHRYYIFSLICYCLALLAKPTMITLPILLIVIELSSDIINKGKISTRFSIKDKIPFFAFAVFCASVAIFSQGSEGGLRNFNEFAFADRLNIAIPAYIIYLGILFWPFNTSIYYPVVDYPPGLACGCILSLLIISSIFWKIKDSVPELILAWIWFIVALLPMVGFVTIGSQAFADRWTLLSHIGPIVALVNLVDRYALGLERLSYFLFCSILTGFSLLTFHDLGYWKDSESIFRRALQVNPNNFMAHTNLGAALIKPEESFEQAFHYEEAVRLNPTYPEALNNLGIVRARQGKISEAYSLFNKALSINPKLVAAMKNLELAKSEMN